MVPNYTQVLKDSVKIDWSIIFGEGKNVIIILGALILGVVLASIIIKFFKRRHNN